MARRLTWILAPEGGSDSDFLLPLIRRLLEELCVRSDHEVEIPDGIDLRNVDGYARGITSVIDVLGQNPGPTLVFVHADADGDADKARQRFVEPIVRSLARGRAAVAVVPIRTIEAWVLADLRSLASVLGATERHLLDSGAPRASTEIEGHGDPKQLLNSLASAVVQRRRRRQLPFRTLGTTVDMSRLRSLSAFATFEAELLAALSTLGVLQR